MPSIKCFTSVCEGFSNEIELLATRFCPNVKMRSVTSCQNSDPQLARWRCEARDSVTLRASIACAAASKLDALLRT
jgi:hypothetical protein